MIDFSIDAYNELVLEKGTHVVQTVIGRPVRVLCTDGPDEEAPVCGVHLDAPFEPDDWPASGVYRSSPGVFFASLKIAPKPPGPLGWVAIVEVFGSVESCLRPTKEAFDTFPCKLLSEPVEIFAKP